MTLPLLSCLIFLPLLGGAAIWLAPSRWAGRIALVAMFAALAAACAAVAAFNPHVVGFQLVEAHAWIASLDIHYRLGVDGLSLLFLPATALLFLGALAAAWSHEDASPRRQWSLLLLLESATFGIFCALDTILFFLFWELTLLPIYFLLGAGSVIPGGSKAAARYFLIMLAGGIPLLFAFIVLASAAPTAAFDVVALLAAPLPLGTQYAVLFLCLLGFAAKVPLVPLHTWLPQFSLAAPGSLTALLVGLKLGAYGLLRFAVPLAPNAAVEAHWLLAGAGTLAVLYGAVGMLAQSNLRVMLAYAGISHVGLAVLGLAALDAQGVQGAVAMLLNFSVAAGGAMLLAECLRQRTGSTDLAALGGVAERQPLLAAGILLCGLAAIGLPGTSGFPGELLVLLAALHTHTGAGLGALFGLVVGAGAMLSFYRRAFFGKPLLPAVMRAPDLQAREWAILTVAALLILGLGLWPGPALNLIEPSAQAWAARLPSPQ